MRNLNFAIAGVALMASTVFERSSTATPFTWFESTETAPPTVLFILFLLYVIRHVFPGIMKPPAALLRTNEKMGGRHLVYFTSTLTRIQGWMQHSNRCSPFERPVISICLPCKILVRAPPIFPKPPEPSSTISSPPLTPPPN